MSMTPNNISYYLKIEQLIDSGKYPCIRIENQGRLVVTNDILKKCGYVSGQVITDEAARALIEINEAALLTLQAEIIAL